MKSVLLSVQPKWCELIASGKKTIEVRKTRPKIDTPFKCYIYCTSIKSMTLEEYVKIHQATSGSIDDWHGKVIGEFVCNHITRIEVLKSGLFTGGSPNGHCVSVVEKSMLSAVEIKDYANNKANVYGWHISNLVIYDKPKALSDFITVDKEAITQCEHRERVYQNPDYVNGAWLFGGYICNKGEIDWCCDCKRKPLKRPPQSWCYVEGAEGK